MNKHGVQEEAGLTNIFVDLGERCGTLVENARLAEKERNSHEKRSEVAIINRSQHELEEIG